MFAKKVFYVFCLAVCSVIVSGATVEFRSGTVIAADFTDRQPDVKLERENVPNRIFARMGVKLAPERKISIYDYRLGAYGRRFNAVALSVNNGKWMTEGESVENIDGKTKVAVLFEVDGSVIGKKDTETFEIVAAADPDAPAAVVKFKNLKKGNFPSVSGIPASGSVVK